MHALVNNQEELQSVQRGKFPGLAMFWIYGVRRVSDFLRVMYQLANIAVQQRKHDKMTTPVFWHEYGPTFDENMRTTKKILSDPAFYRILPRIAEAMALTPSQAAIWTPFIERVLLDIACLENNLVPPTYIDRPEHLADMAPRFPPPGGLPKDDVSRGFAIDSIPGMFPEDPTKAQQRTDDVPWDSSSRPLGRIGRARAAQLREQSAVDPLSRVMGSKVGKRSVTGRSKFNSPMAPRSRPSVRSDSPWGRGSTPRDSSADSRASSNLGSLLAQHTAKASAWLTRPQLTERRFDKSVQSTSNGVELWGQDQLHIGLDTSTYDESSVEPMEEDNVSDHLPFPNMSASDMEVEYPSRITEKGLRRESQRPNWGLEDFMADGDVPRFYEPTVPVHWMTPEKKKSDLMEMFSKPSPAGLKQSDDSRAEIEQRKQLEAAKAAEEKRRALEKAKKEAEERLKKETEERLAKSGGLRVPKQQFVGPISSDWTQRARATMSAPGDSKLATTGEGVDLRRHDFSKVVPETEWLNDEIVNGALNWLDRAINSAAGIKNPKTQTRRCLCLSSFFFKRLREQGPTGTTRTLSRNGVRKDNLLDVDTILVPICESMHWTLLVVRPSRRTVAHMDSLNPRGSAANTDLGLAWMRDVLGDKFVADDWKVVRHEAPRQTNGWDCGVHTITNAMCVGLGLSPVDSYSATDMPLQRLRIACMFLNGGFQGDFDLGVY